MKTTDLTISDYDIEVNYGGVKYRDTPRKEAYGHVKYLYTDLTDIRKYYIRLGFHLDEFERCGYYFDFGYPTLESFCQSNLGLDKSAVSRCIGVYREFNAKDDQKSRCGVISKGSAIELSEKWQDYSYTQLCEMLPLSPEQREMVSPDMTIKQIRDYKKSLKNKPVASTQQEDSECEAVALTQLKQFDFDEYKKKRGIVQINYIKSCDPVKNGLSCSLCLFDGSGKKIIDAPCDILLNVTEPEDCEIVIRLCDPYEYDQSDQEGDCNE